MTVPSRPGEGSSYSVADPATYQKRLDIRMGHAEAFLVEMAQWARIRRRVQKLESRWSINWFTTGASSATSITIAAAIAAIVLPSGSQTGISGTVAPVLWVIAAASAVLAVALAGLAMFAHGERAATGADIVDEMDTIEKAWEQRTHESVE